LVTDYLGTDVLASYAPLDLPGLRWGIVAKFSRAEASEPIGNLQRDLLVATGVIVLVLTGLAMTLSSVFVRPIEQLIGWTTRIESGDLSGPALRNELDGRDEFGELAASLDRMVATLRDQRGALEAKNAENERLVDSLMPPAIAARLRAGERSIADEYPNVTVIHARLRGFTSLTVGESAERAAEILNDLANTLDAAAERHGIEKIKTVGDSYIAVCGLSVPRLDGRRRAVEFAMELCRSIGMYGQGNHLTLSGSVGIAFGSVEAGVIGMHRPMFEIWGVTPARAEALVDRAGAGAIQVDGEVSAQLAELFAFTPEGEVVVEGMTSPAQAFGVVLADTGVAIAAEPAEDIGGRKDAVAAGDRAEAGGDRYR
jgi:class 3 adenylate cyclase